MKKIYLSVLAIIAFTSSLYAQVTTDPSTGNVGISTTPNSSKLTVNGNTQVVGQIRADLGTNGTSLVLTGGASNFQIGHDGTPNTQIFNSSGGAIQFNNYANSSTLFHIDGNGYVGIGTTNPNQKLTINGGGIGFDWNSTDKKLYSPNDGDLEWMTHNGAIVHGFAVSHQGTKIVYLNTNGNSYFNGGNVGIGTGSPEELLEIKSVKPVQTFHEPGIASFKIGVDNGVFKIVGMDNGFGGHIGDFNNRNNGQGFSMDNLGHIGIGTYDTKGYRFAVAGDAIAESMTVKLQANWPDYVFKKDYVLTPLPEVKTYIDENQHLPEMPSEKEVIEKGLNLGEMNKLLTKKVEELTLYLIRKDEEIKIIRDQQETELKAQAAINQKLLAQLTEIQNQLKLPRK